MATFRRAHKKNYTVINNRTLQDSRLSYRARGVLTTLLSYPDDWTISVAHLEKQSAKEGRDAIKSALKELEAFGYLVRSQNRTDTGKFSSSEYLVYEASRLADDGKTDGGEPVDGLADDGLSAPTKYYIDNKVIKEQSTHPLPPQRGCEQSSSIDVEIAIEPEPEPIAESTTTAKNGESVSLEKQNPGKDRSSALTVASADPFLNRRSSLSLQKEKALEESLVGSPFDSIASQDEFFSQHLDYIRATSPNLNPGQVIAIAKASLRRIMAGIAEPEDRRVLALWERGMLGQFQGATYSDYERKRMERRRMLEQTAERYLAEKEKEANRGR